MKPDTPEDIVQEYISALKYHIDHNLIIKKEWNKIAKAINQYLKEKK
jgi:hypothetical protein